MSSYALDLDNDVSNRTCDTACSGGNVHFSNFNYVADDCILEDEEEVTPDPDEGDEDETNPEPPTPSPTVLNFPVKTDCPVYGPEYDMALQGLEGRSLTTEDATAYMGPENRAFLAIDSSNTWDSHYKHNLIGGSMKFEVDVNDVDCACAAGVFAVNTDYDQCMYDAYEQNVTPQCASIDIMEANIFGFNVQSQSCEFDFCDPSATCMNTLNEWEYGPSSEYTINSMQSYSVKTQFFARPGNDGEPDALALIRTTLSQDGVDVILEQDCPDYLAALSWKLDYNMTIAISTYSLDLQNNVSKDSCSSSCTGGNMVIANLQFVSGDSILEQDLIIG